MRQRVCRIPIKIEPVVRSVYLAPVKELAVLKEGVVVTAPLKRSMQMINKTIGALDSGIFLCMHVLIPIINILLVFRGPGNRADRAINKSPTTIQRGTIFVDFSSKEL
jgi:hypothetical protein